MRKIFNRKKGMSLAVVLMVITIMVVIGLSISFIGTQNLRNVRKNNENVSAHYAAEAGLSRGIAQINQDDEWTGEEPEYTNTEMPNSNNITYSVRVYNNKDGTGAIPAENGISVPAGGIYIVSEGKVGPPDNPNSTKKVGAMLFRRIRSIWEFGLFAKDSLDFRGNIKVYAYDSSQNDIDKPGEADVGTNGIQAGAVNVSGMAAVIDGDVVTGPGSTGSTVTANHNWSPSGDIRVNSQEEEIPEVTLPMDQNGNLLYPDGAEPLPTSGKKKGGAVYLTPGHYEELKKQAQDQYVLKNYGTEESPSIYVFDGIDLAGGAQLVVDNSNGPVIVYVNGDVNLRGKGNLNGLDWLGTGNTPKPTDIRIYATENCEVIDMAGNPTCYAPIVAPYTDVRIHGNVDVYGAIIADNIAILGNPTFMYDVALKNLNDLEQPRWVVTSKQKF